MPQPNDSANVQDALDLLEIICSGDPFVRNLSLDLGKHCSGLQSGGVS